MVTADHGPAVSGAHNTIICARAGKDLVSSLTSGLLTIVSMVFPGGAQQGLGCGTMLLGYGRVLEEALEGKSLCRGCSGHARWSANLKENHSSGQHGVASPTG